MLHIGSYVKVPRMSDNISTFNDKGFVTAIMEPYCKVLIRYGKRMKGTWEGKITDVYHITNPPPDAN